MEILKYRCEVGEKKRARLAQQKYEKEKQDALRKAADKAKREQELAVEMAERQLRELLVAESEEKMRKAVQKTKHEMEVSVLAVVKSHRMIEDSTFRHSLGQFEM
jgi:TRAP-type C4-dicarboxylate transport system substrate-binding protein